METDNAYGPITSSVNSQEISTTIQALAKVLAGVLLSAGVLSAADYTTIFTQVPQLVTDIIALAPVAYAAWHAAEVLFGIFRKVLVSLFKKKGVAAGTPVTVVNPS